MEIAKHKEQGAGKEKERVFIQYGQKKRGGDLPPLHRRTSQNLFV